MWRRQAARAFSDLADDLANGDWPQPRCAAEEMALHLAIRTARDAIDDDWISATRAIKSLPAHPDDFDWDMANDVLFQDHDILNLFDIELDGIEDPATDQNQSIGMGDYRPHTWFNPFNDFPPRDGRRPFRRWLSPKRAEASAWRLQNQRIIGTCDLSGVNYPGNQPRPAKT